jgi:polysaccharide deacetylase family protein (PEP-CTERM system associated)
VTNAFTIDVEDYFHPSEVSQSVPITRWPTLDSRVHIGTEMLLEDLEASGTRATFFVLGWVAARHPRLIRRIADSGHDIGCHSHLHGLVYDMAPAEFRRDTLEACKAIEDACGLTPRAYRAPSYSIVEKSLWALEVLAECGFTHDSSIFPITHDRYGIPGARRNTHTVMTPAGPLVEVPVATVRLRSGRIAPVGGGAYLRLFPYGYTAAGIRRLNYIERQPACIYIHPWELDPDQPRLVSGFVSRLRTYSGLRTVREKVRRLLSDFSFAPLASMSNAAAPPAGRQRAAQAVTG